MYTIIIILFLIFMYFIYFSNLMAWAMNTTMLDRSVKNKHISLVLNLGERNVQSLSCVRLFVTP